MKITKFNANAIEEKIGYTFKNKDLLEQAFTRSSYAKENSFSESNEVLEFIGDSVLGMIVVKHLSQRYEDVSFCTEKNYFSCELDEAELSEYKINLVQRASLALATEQAELEQYLRLGKSDIVGEIQNEASVKEDLLEAILGAAAIDSKWNLDSLERIIQKLIDIDSRLEQSEFSVSEQKKELDQKFGLDFLKIDEIDSYCPSLKFGYLITLGDHILSITCSGYGNTKEGALKMAVSRAAKQFKEAKDRSSIVINTVGEPTLERAVNQLQELHQKNIIPEPQYNFSKHLNTAQGNPQWGCSCTVPGVWETVAEHIETNQAKAKKSAAFEVLMALVGRDMSSFVFRAPTANTKEETL